MANHKSAIKRAKQNEVHRLRNRSIKSRVKSITKAIHAATAELKEAQSIIDKAASKGVLHKRAASRRKSRLARLINKRSLDA